MTLSNVLFDSTFSQGLLRARGGGNRLNGLARVVWILAGFRLIRFGGLTRVESSGGADCVRTVLTDTADGSTSAGTAQALTHYEHGAGRCPAAISARVLRFRLVHAFRLRTTFGLQR